MITRSAYTIGAQLGSVEIPWLRESGDDPLPRTNLGQVKIDERRLVAEVNSEARAARFRDIADRELPAGSRYLSTVLTPLEAALKAYRDEHPEPPSTSELENRPEVQALKASTSAITTDGGSTCHSRL